ncbi:MAG TPA: hypothetical protein VIL01_09205 [Thermomicrobiales bacterium]|jgi:hypothetical protein
MEWPEAMIATAGTLAVFAVAIVAVWQGFKTWQAKVAARVEVAQDEAYRKLAEETLAAQRALKSELADLRERVVTIEKMLREVG